jgi:hypothetical protein
MNVGRKESWLSRRKVGGRISLERSESFSKAVQRAVKVLLRHLRIEQKNVQQWEANTLYNFCSAMEILIARTELRCQSASLSKSQRSENEHEIGDKGSTEESLWLKNYLTSKRLGKFVPVLKQLSTKRWRSLKECLYRSSFSLSRH